MNHRENIFMKYSILIGLGGGLGAIARYQISSLIFLITEAHVFPWATFFVNILGSSLCGFVLSYLSYQQELSLDYKFFAITGFLGGFTTFSTFSLDLFTLIKTRHLSIALAYAFLSVLISLLGFFLGHSMPILKK